MRHIITTDERENFAKTTSVINSVWVLIGKITLFVGSYLKKSGQKSLLKVPAINSFESSLTNVKDDESENTHDMNTPVEQINDAMKLYNLKAKLGGNTVTSPIKSDTTRTYRITSAFDESIRQWETHLTDADLVVDSSFREDDPGKQPSLFKGTATTILLVLFSVLSVFGNKAASIDLSLRSTVSNSSPTVGGSVKFTVWLKNQGATAASSIVVKNTYPKNGVTLTGNTGGVNFTYNTGTGIGLWSVSTLAAGDSVSLELTGTVTQKGVHFNVAEINSISGSDTDTDSTPGNGVLGEDDITTACFSIPLYIYAGNPQTVSLPAAFKKNNTVKWFRNSVEITGSTTEAVVNADTSLTIKAIGNYTFTTTVGGCSGQGCCTIQAIAGPYGSIGNLVWKDKNDNGVQDVNEPGVKNIILELYTLDNQGHVPANPVQKDTTDNTGNYLFQNLLSGDYLVKAVFSNLSDTLQISRKRDTGTDDAKDNDFSTATGYSTKVTINVDSTGNKKDNLTVDAALYTPVGNIGDRVWSDSNNNGIQDGGETGVANIILELYRADDSGNIVGSAIAKDTTNANGFYQFSNLVKGNYVVKLLATSVPAGTIISTKSNLGEDDATDSDFSSTTGLSARITLDPYNFNIDPLNKDNLTIDAALYTPLGTIGDFVWKDLDNDGVQDTGEPGVHGVIMQLFAANNDGAPTGSVLKTDTTDVDGHYLFSALAQGNYVVKLLKSSLASEFFISEMKDAGGNDAKDSDFDATSGNSPKIVINPTVNDTKDILSIDCGLHEVVTCPTLTVSTTDGDICVGDSTTIKAVTSNSASIKWYLSATTGTPVFTTGSNESRSVSPTTTTTYYAEINGLHSSCPNLRQPVAITVNTRPTIPTSAEAVDACTGETVNLNNYVINGVTTPGGTFEWHTTANGNSPLVASPAAVGAGTYYLFEKSGAGCYSPPRALRVSIKNCSTLVDLSLVKTVSNLTPNVSDNITYTIRVTNEGTNAATNVEIEDQMPTGLEFISSSFFTKSGSILTASISNIAARQTIILTYVAKVTSAGDKINFAQIKKADQKDADSTPGNASTASEDDNSKVIISAVQAQTMADLSLDKTVNKSTAAIGELVSYYITTINNGTHKATNVEIQDVLPTGLEVVTVSGANSITISGSTVTAKFDQIEVGYAVTFQIIARVTATGGVIRNWAQVSKSDQPDNDSTPNNGTNNGEDDTNYVDINIAEGVCNPPVPLISTSTPFICLGESVTLNSIGCTGTVIWSTGATANSITVNPITNTTYTAKCKLSADCLSGNSNPITVTVNSIVPPLITSDAPNNAICTGGSVKLSSSSCNGSVIWSNGTTATSITVSPTTTTTYTAVCKINNCTSGSSSPLTITVGNSGTTPTIAASKTTICSGESVTLTANNCYGTILWSNGATASVVSVSPSATGTYSVTCTLSGCGSQTSAPITINVIASAEIPVISATKEIICAGTNTNLSATGCSGTLVWSNGVSSSAIAVSPSATTTYEVTCKIGQCSGKASITIAVKPQPAAPVITSAKTQICAGESVILTANNCDGQIRWNTEATGASLTVNPTETSSYTAICTVNDCSSPLSAAKTITVAGASAVITASKDAICAGNTSVLTASNCQGNISWNTGQTTSVITVNPTTTTTYTVTCTAGSCNGTASKTVTVNSQPPAAPVISASNISFCISGEVTLTATGCSGVVLWSNSQTGTSITVSVNSDIVFAAACKVGECESEKSNNILVTVGKINKPTISSIFTTICAGDTIELASSGCLGTTVWSTGQTGSTIMVNPNTSAEYSAVCKQSNCTSEESNKLSITVALQPGQPSATALVKNTCPATTVNLSNAVTSTPTTTGGLFEFHTGANKSSPTLNNITAVGAGIYYVFEKSTSGCYGAGTPVQVGIDNCSVNPVDPSTNIDLDIKITGSVTEAQMGDELTYTIAITNKSLLTATNVHVTNVLPKGLAITSATSGLTAFGSDSLISIIGALPGGSTLTYTYTAKITKAGTIRNIAKITKLNQTDPVHGNNTSHWDVSCGSCRENCVAIALAADTTRQSNGSYNIAFRALVENCGNVKLEKVKITENLATMFPSHVNFTVVQKPTVNAGSHLVPNNAFNGSSDINLVLQDSSAIEGGRIDTVKFVINIVPNDNNGPFSTVASVTGTGKNTDNEPEEVTDVSNNGLYINKPSSEPTVIRLFKSPAIGLAKIVSDTARQSNGSYNVTYQLLVKNNGSLPLTNVVLTDTLSKVFKLPATFTIAGAPDKNTGSQLVVNSAFNGVSDTRLTLPESILAVGQTDTLKFSVNLRPDTLKLFANQAVVHAKGKLGADPEQTVTDLSNAGTNPDVHGANPTNLSLTKGSINLTEKPCLGVSLYVKDTVKLEDGSYNIFFRSVIRNCGNMDLLNIQLCDTLLNTFPLPVEAKIIEGPATNAGSQLIADTTYNGVSNTCLLRSGSTLAIGKVDTVKWVVNVKLHDNKGPFTNSIIATGKTANDITVRDTSNDGINPDSEGNTPTVINFNTLPQALIGISKEAGEPVKVGDKTYVVTFKLKVKNYGKIDFTGVQVQDNLAVTFGDSVRIDSVGITAEAGFVINPNFTGRGSLINMLVDSLSTLPAHTTRSLTLVTKVTLTEGKTRFENQALAIGRYPTFQSVDDLSTNGSNPDSDNDGDPRNNKEFTPIDLSGPKIPLGIAKSAELDTVQNADDTFNLIYRFVVKNYGTTRLTNVQLSDSLETVFADDNKFLIVEQPTLSAGSHLKLNPDFNGRQITTLLLADSSYLEPGASDTLELKMRILNKKPLPAEFANTAYGSATDSTVNVTDLSQSGTDPDPDGDNNPGNNNEPTLILITEQIISPDTVVVIPGGFSPNHDNVGDTFFIQGVSTSGRAARIYIYNRWGVMVYKNEDYGNSDGWDGKANNGVVLLTNGMEVPEGTYYYVLEVPGLWNNKPRIGFVTIAK